MGQKEGQAGETIGARLRRLRLEGGLSQRELAVPGVSYAYISRIEAGTRQPSVKALRKLAAQLGVTADYLETGSELDAGGARELRLSDAQLALRLGESGSAERELREIYDDAVRAADRSVASRALLELALIADERGDHAGAIERFEQAFELERPSPLERTDVFSTLGRAYGAVGRTKREIELYEDCLEEVEQLGEADVSLATRYRIYLSYALSDAGEFARAEQLLRETLAANERSDDRLTRIRLYWSLARLCEMEGRSKVALRYARAAITLLEASEDNFQRARAHLLAAWIMNSARDPDGARGQLERAERLFGDGASADDLAILYVEQARAHVLLGESDEATAMAQQAVALLGDQNGPTIGTAHWVMGEGLALQGDIDAANVAFARGVDLLEQNRRWREAAEASRSWARMLREAGRHEEALDVLDRSTDFALRLSPEHTRQ